MKATTVVLALGFCGLFTRAMAQQPAGVRNKETKQRTTAATPVTDTAALQPAAPGQVKYFYFPEFYHHWPVDHNDTILKYECYDAYNAQLNVDTLNDANVLQHIYFVKTFTNYMHTFIDVDGKPKPSVVRKTVFRYDKMESDAWKCLEYSNGNVTEVKEIKSNIVRADTTVIADPLTGANQMTVRRYYRVVEVEKPAKPTTEE